MSARLTIVYLTNRRQPRLDWFLTSLRRERNSFNPPQPQVDVVVVDHFCGELNTADGTTWTPPKPNVWNGPHRLTKEDWFAAGSARNTGLCFTRTDWVAFVDDLSVLMPGWLRHALEATTFSRTITCGAYRKVAQLVVGPEGDVKSHHFIEGGVDNRQRHVDPELSGTVVVPAGGSWLYGCSCVAPVEAFLQINGWAEDISGGIGFEDCLTGVVLENAGFKFRYDTRMLTLESEEDHHVEPPFRKTDKGTSPLDKSHKALDRAKLLKRFGNDFELRYLRESILAGHSFPIPTGPTTDWFDQQPLSEM